MELNALLAQPVALPSLPRTVALLMSELAHEEPSLRRLNQLFGTDPALAGRLLELANSHTFQVPRQIAGIPEALALLGIAQVRTLVTSAPLGTASRSVPGVHMQQFWRYSLNTAKACRALAPGLRLHDGASFTAGLVHAVGDLVMHIGMPDVVAKIDFSVAPLDLHRAEAERAHLGYTYADVSAGFAKKWDFPDSIVRALQHQLLQLLPVIKVKHHAGWVMRAVHDNKPRLRCDSAMHRLPVNLVLRSSKLNMNGFATRQLYRGLITVIGRIKDDDFITWVDERHHGQYQSAARA